MQQIDAAAMRFGISRLLLMDHAGLALARETRALATPGSSILLCCGSGYNGGDGLAAGRHLLGWGYRIEVILSSDASALREEPAIFASILRQLGADARPIDAASWGAFDEATARAAVIVDALLGIGATGVVREPARTMIERINVSGKPVVSADLPSGLHGDDGTVQGSAVRAAVTVAFGLAKQGCVRGEGPARCGRLVVDSITIPEQLLRGQGEG